MGSSRVQLVVGGELRDCTCVLLNSSGRSVGTRMSGDQHRGPGGPKPGRPTLGGTCGGKHAFFWPRGFSTVRRLVMGDGFVHEAQS
jgi:hypothetical protein